MPLITNPTEPTVLLLEVRIGGRVLRFAERPLEVNGVRFTGALSCDYHEEIELTADGPPQRSIAVQLGGEDDWGALRGHLPDARATLYEWAGGDTLEARLVGILAEAAVADPDLPPGVAAFTVADVDAEDRPLLVESAMVGDDTWPITTPAGYLGDDIPSAFAKAYYPEVIGRPGYPFPTWFTAEGVAPGSPALVVQHGNPLYEEKTLILAKRGASRVTVARAWDQDGGTEVGDLMTVTDLRGQAVTVFDTTLLSTLVMPGFASEVSTGWAVGWYDPPTTGPGGALRGLGDVLVWALERAGVDQPGAERGRSWDIDWHAMLDARARLNRFKIDTYIADQVGVWAWLASDVLPFFPVFFARSGKGVYFAEWRYRAAPSEAVLTIEVGRNAQRLSAVGVQDNPDVYTEITVNLGLDTRSGKALRALTFTGAAAVGLPTEGKARHRLLEDAWPRVGRRTTTIDVPIVADTATGYEVGEFLCARYAGPLTDCWVRMSYRFSYLRPGMVVRLVDEESGLDAVGTLTTRKPGPGCVDLAVLIHPGK